MRYLGIAWHIVLKLAMGAVILAVLNLARSPFETAVLSTLVLIYILLQDSTVSLGLLQSRQWNNDLDRHISIARALHLNTEILEAAQKENEDDEEPRQALFWIATTFNTLFTLIALWHLFVAITSSRV